MRTETAARVLALLVVLGALAAPWPLAGCTSRPPEHDLPFDTIERGDFGTHYYQHRPVAQHLFLVASTEAARRADWADPQGRERLAQIDYKTYFVLALFRGGFGSSGYDAIIQRVTRQGDHLVVQAQLVLETQVLTPTPPPEIRRLTPTPAHQ